MDPKLNPLNSTPMAILLGAVVIAMAILVNGGYIKLGKMAGTPLQAGQATAQPSGSPQAPTKVNVSAGHLPIKGDAKAKVTIVEFADFRCPFCEKLFTEVEPSLMKDYVDTGKAKFAFRHFAFLGPASIVAANAAECANEQGKFWQMHDYFYQNQPNESDTSLYTVDKLTTVAGTLGMDSGQFSSCLSANKYNQNVTNDLNDGQKAGVNATPSILINGMIIAGACPYSTFDGAIKAELAGKSWSVNNCQLIQ